ncbi:MAG: hypothetical protein ACYC65_06750 [Candidatus Limnocylindrales bacterium]
MTRTTPSRTSSRTRGSMTLGLSLASLLLVAACSGGTTPEPSIATLATQAPASGTGAAAPTVRPSLSPEDREDALLAFAACMRDNGIDMPDPQFGLDGKANMGTLFGELDQNDADVQAATEVCDAYLPSSLADDPVLQAERQDVLLEFAACMRDNGVEMDDPTAGGGPGRGPMATLDQNDPTVAAGLEVCRPLLGTQGGGE